MKHFLILLSLLLSSAVFAVFPSGEEQAERQARSVHLLHRGWEGPAKIFYIEATPIQTYPGTYFCTISFDGGYCGIQEHYDGKRLVIFSVWEPGDPFDFNAHPDAVEESKRTQSLYGGEGVQIQRFGGEGTGGKSLVGFSWQNGRPVSMAISVAQLTQYRTAYTCWIWDDAKATWFRMATFSTLLNEGKGSLTTPYSFLEDFLRNGESRNHVRCGTTSRLWVWNGKTWSASTEATFSADNNTLTTIDAGPAADGFWFATGGKTQNVTTQLWSNIKPGGVMDDSHLRRMRLVEHVLALEQPVATPTSEPKPAPQPTPAN